MGTYVDAARFAVTGLLVGATVAAGTDLVFDYALGSLVPGATSDTTVAGQYGRGAFAVVAAGTVLAGGLLVGESVLDMLNAGVQDPLFRAIYYTTAIAGSTTSQNASGMVRGLLMRVTKPVTQKQVAPTTSSGAATGGCSSGSCSM